MPNKRKKLKNGKSPHRGKINTNLYETTFGREEDESKSLSHDATNPDVVVKKKDKKLVFLSKTVLQKILSKTMTTGTQVFLILMTHL